MIQTFFFFEKDIRFTFLPPTFGLWKETIEVRDCNSSLKQQIQIRLFADEDTLETNLENSVLVLKDISLQQTVLEDPSFKYYHSSS